MRRAPFRWLSALGERGNVALMTAIFAPVLLLVGGFAIDYGYASYINQRLTQATDNAVLASVSQSAATAVGGFSNTSGLQTYGTNVFNNNIADLPVTGVSFTLNVTSNGSLGVNSQGSYSYQYPTFFSKVMGIPTMKMGSQIQASANPITYLDVYVIIDVSQSMGVGSTTADMNALYQRGLTNGGGAFGEQSCVFGCHVKAEGQNGSYTNEQIAHNISPRINLRIDAAVSAIQNLIQTAQQKAGTNQNIRIGLYTINHEQGSSTYYTTISQPSSDYATLLSLAAAIDLPNNTASYGDTEFATTFTNFAQTAFSYPNGSGASAIAPKNYVFLISDGMADKGNLTPCVESGGPSTCTAPIVGSACSPLKNKSTVGVIYTVYNPIYKNNDSSQGLEPLIFKALVAPYLTFNSQGAVTDDQMADGLTACSSTPSMFFPATDGPAINNAVQALFASTLQDARLTH